MPLPHDPEAERALVGACLLTPERVGIVTSIVDPDDLHDARLRAVLEPLADFDAAGRHWDLATLASELEHRGTAKLVGGIEGLSALADHGAHGFLVEQHARRVRAFAAARRLAQVSAEAWEKGKHVTDPDAYVDEVAQALGRASLRKRDGVAKIGDVAEQVAERLLSGSKGPCVETRFPDFDAVTGGFRPPESTVIAARPGTGKSALALDIAMTPSETVPVLVFSLEMSRAQLTERVIATRAHVNSMKLRNPETLTDDERKRIRYHAAKLRDSRVGIVDARGLHINDMRARARGWRHQNPDEQALIIVDYLQLGTADGKTREQEVSAISRGITYMAGELSVPVCALAQINRNVEHRDGGRPRLSDLRESGAIEQDMNKIVFLSIDKVLWVCTKCAHAVENNRPPTCSMCGNRYMRNIKRVNVDIAKNREGPTAMLQLHYEGRYFRFESVSERET